MKKRQMYRKIRMHKNQRGAKSEGARKLEARNLEIRYYMSNSSKIIEK